MDLDSVSPLQPGHRLDERYNLVRLLGTGGMGEVYEAWDEELSIPVALKILFAHDVAALHRMRKEVLLARSVTHPHVCRVFDVGRHRDAHRTIWFLTMEILRGETLFQRLRARGRFTTSEALPFVEQMLSGLEAAHRSGVIHQDFKSANVMLVNEDGRERAVITDFGLSLRVDEMASGDDADMLVGTPAYMSPEQVLGRPLGPASDIYSVGVVLFEMVTGSHPFSGSTVLEVLRRRLEEEAPSPRALVPDLDPLWDEIIRRCLERAPEARIASASDVLRMLIRREHELQPTAELVPVPALAVERDTFVGREAELERMRELLGEVRLLTLQGAGGLGKSRLALRFALENQTYWKGGVWFSDLAEAREDHEVLATIAGTIGVPLGADRSADPIGRALAGRGECLVVLDNCERVVDVAVRFVGRWLEQAGQVRFLVTSRERLNLAGESVLTLDPFDLDRGVELFLDRARRHRPGFEPDAQATSDIRRIVELIEGIPLAVELAAARVRMMATSELAARMENRASVVLGGAGRGRHATLRTAIEGSWELLSPWEQAAWMQCSIFDGGFTLDAAESVVDSSQWPEAPETLDVVQSLLDKSLLRMWMPASSPTEAPETRLGMFMSLQEFAREQLERSTDALVRQRLEERHGAWYARFGTDQTFDRMDLTGGMPRRILARELENLIAACKRAASRGDESIAVATLRAAFAVLATQGPFAPAVTLGELVIRITRTPAARARALETLGRAKWHAQSDGREQLEEARALYRQLGERRREGEVVWSLGAFANNAARLEEAAQFYEDALAIHREVGNRRFEGIALAGLGSIHLGRGQPSEARSFYEQALAIYAEIGDRRFEGIALGELGNLHLEHGSLEEARRCHLAALQIHRQTGNRLFEGIVLGNLGLVCHREGELETARRNFEKALAIHRGMGNRRSEGFIRMNLGDLERDLGRLEQSWIHHEAARAIHHELGNRRFEAVALLNLAQLRIDGGQFEEARDLLERGEAAVRTVDAPYDLLLILCRRVELERLASGRIDERTFQEIEEVAARVTLASDSELERTVDAVLKLRKRES